MAHRSPAALSHSLVPQLYRRPSRRGMIAGALALALVASAVPALSGCKAVPFMMNTVLSWCLQAVSKVLAEPVNALPAGYSACGQHTWSVRGEKVKFCLYCSPVPSDPVLVQLDCAGDFYPIKLRDREHAAPAGTISESGQAGIQQLQCDQYLLSLAQAQTDEFQSRVDASIIAPNRRPIPSIQGYDELGIEVDGTPFVPDGTVEVRAGAAIRIHGAFDQVARYVAEAGVRSIEFREDGNAWAIDLNPEFSAIAVFKNARLVETRFLFAPPEAP